MNNPYVKIKRWGFGGNCDMLVWGNGKDEWCKNLAEFTSYINVSKTPEEALRLKNMFCKRISEDLNIPFTIQDLDRIVTKKDYQIGEYIFAEYKHIVETNIKCVEQGKPPKYLAPSIAGDRLIKSLLNKE